MKEYGGLMMVHISNCRFAFLALIFFVLACSAAAQEQLTYGSKVLPHDVDEGKALSQFYIGPEFVFVDGNLKRLFDDGDPVYIHFDPSSSTIDENDVRITPLGIFAAGSQVRLTDVDHGNTFMRFGTDFIPAAELRYFDVDGDRAYSQNDPVYLDLGPGRITAGDIRITSYRDYPAGSRVRNSDSDSDKPTSTLPGMLSFYNYNGNINNRGWGIYDEGDIVYIDTQFPFNEITVNDVRISMAYGSFDLGALSQ